jgi:hypothetical protein
MARQREKQTDRGNLQKVQTCTNTNLIVQVVVELSIGNWHTYLVRIRKKKGERERKEYPDGQLTYITE